MQPGTRIGYLMQSPDLSGAGTVADFVAKAVPGMEIGDYRIQRVLDHLDLAAQRRRSWIRSRASSASRSGMRFMGMILAALRMALVDPTASARATQAPLMMARL